MLLRQVLDIGIRHRDRGLCRRVLAKDLGLEILAKDGIPTCISCLLLSSSGKRISTIPSDP